jgi:rSAM/selenodomain-associated transferase 1
MDARQGVASVSDRSPNVRDRDSEDANPEPFVHVLMARAPAPGKAKTRLAAGTSSAFAAQFQAACIRDWLARPRWAAHHIALVEGESSLWDDAREQGWNIESQRGGDLGERLAHALHVARRWATKVVITGTDSPDLPQLMLLDAAAWAGPSRVAFVGAHDGGYAAVAAPTLCEGLFENIPWSDPETLAASLRRAQALSLEALVVGTWWDVDTVADLGRLVFNESEEVDGHLSYRATHARTTIRSGWS